ncbi:hypothetical protein B0H13DRAFT_2675673 [Mycena leptocephala]|nr:hypothetical protein B0H13DRAFT_2675673 [Mycena leptocephala]
MAASASDPYSVQRMARASERGSTACGARALELVFTPFALALPSRPQSMGRAAEALRGNGVDHDQHRIANLEPLRPLHAAPPLTSTTEGLVPIDRGSSGGPPLFTPQPSHPGSGRPAVPALVTLALHLLLDASSPWPSPCGRPLLRQPSYLRVRSSGACRHSTSRPREQASTRTVASVPHGGQRRGRRHLRAPSFFSSADARWGEHSPHQAAWSVGHMRAVHSFPSLLCIPHHIDPQLPVFLVSYHRWSPRPVTLPPLSSPPQLLRIPLLTPHWFSTLDTVTLPLHLLSSSPVSILTPAHACISPVLASVPPFVHARQGEEGWAGGPTGRRDTDGDARARAGRESRDEVVLRSTVPAGASVERDSPAIRDASTTSPSPFLPLFSIPTDSQAADSLPARSITWSTLPHMSIPLDSTYDVWMVALVLETFLFGMDVLQTWIYFAGRPTDVASIKWTVLVVLSSYFRFVQRFGEIQIDLIWVDSLQLLAAYLSAFMVQLYFATRIFKLTKGYRGKSLVLTIGIYTFLGLAVVQIVAGITQTVWSYKLRSFLNLGETKAVTTLQAAASLACDLLITIYLCLFLESQKGEMMKTNSMTDMLVHDAINQGTLTALSSGVTMVLFLALPDTFWFFLGLAPSSKLYMNSMLATLNTRQRIRDKIATNYKGWNSIPMGTIATTMPKTLQCSVSYPPDVHDKGRDFLP